MSKQPDKTELLKTLSQRHRKLRRQIAELEKEAALVSDEFTKAAASVSVARKMQKLDRSLTPAERAALKAGKD